MTSPPLTATRQMPVPPSAAATTSTEPAIARSGTRCFVPDSVQAPAARVALVAEELAADRRSGAPASAQARVVGSSGNPPNTGPASATVDHHGPGYST